MGSTAMCVFVFRMTLFVFVTGVLLLNLASVKGESEPLDDATTTTPDYSEPEDGDSPLTPGYSEEPEEDDSVVPETTDNSEEPDDGDSAVTAAPEYSEWTTPDYDYNVTFEYDFYTEKPLEDDSTHDLQEVSDPTGTSEPEEDDSAVMETPDDSEPEDGDSAVTAAPDYSQWSTPDYDYNVTFEYDFYTEKPMEADSAVEL